jgi:hypothetical protein
MNEAEKYQQMTLEQLEREQLALMSVLAGWVVEYEQFRPEVERLTRLMEGTTANLQLVQTEMLERMKERHR